MNPLDPQPMSDVEIADLVARVRVNAIAAGCRSHLHHPATTRSRCAARYARLVNCSLGEAAVTFEITPQAVRYGWLALYPGVSVIPALRGAA